MKIKLDIIIKMMKRFKMMITMKVIGMMEIKMMIKRIKRIKKITV
nr:MAG: hypothetical protein [Bacteriophage sp.]